MKKRGIGQCLLAGVIFVILFAIIAIVVLAKSAQYADIGLALSLVGLLLMNLYARWYLE